MLEQGFTIILVSVYSIVGDLGLSIMSLTLLIRSLLIPFTLPSLRARKKMNELKPKLDKLKKKHKGDKQALQKAQMELYKKYNVNPLAGCLPQILQIVILIGLYQTLKGVLAGGMLDGVTVDPNFLWLNLTEPDPNYILPVLAGLVQFVLAIMISPGAEIRDIVPNESKSKKVQKENEEEEDTAEMAKAMQQQMMFIMPIMTTFIALKFPAGLALYWVTTNIFSIAQQYFISGWGGLKTYYLRIKQKISK